MAEKEKPKSQVEKFRDLARKIGADESEEPLNEALRKVGKDRPITPSDAVKNK